MPAHPKNQTPDPKPMFEIAAIVESGKVSFVIQKTLIELKVSDAAFKHPKIIINDAVQIVGKGLFTDMGKALADAIQDHWEKQKAENEKHASDN